MAAVMMVNARIYNPALEQGAQTIVFGALTSGLFCGRITFNTTD
jgi:hypothetical protein